MPREMFGDIVDPSVRVGTKKWYTVPLSILTHTVVLGALIIVPLLATDMLPTPASVLMEVSVPVPPPPPPPPPPPAPPPPTTPQPVAEVNPAAAPVEAPPEVAPEPPPPPPSSSMVAGVTGGVPGGIPGGTPGGVVGGITAPPPPPPPAGPIRVGGDVQPPQKTKNVAPVYPPIAQTAKIEGLVIIEAVIGTDGRVKDAKVLRSVNMLDQAALDAVRLWEFTPTLLNGVPVEVIMNVTVNFTLNR